MVPPAFIFGLGVAWGVGFGLPIYYYLDKMMSKKVTRYDHTGSEFKDREQMQGRWMG